MLLVTPALRVHFSTSQRFTTAAAVSSNIFTPAKACCVGRDSASWSTANMKIFNNSTRHFGTNDLSKLRWPRPWQSKALMI